MLKSNCRTGEVEFHFYFLTYSHQFVVHLGRFAILNMLFVVLLYCETRKTKTKKDSIFLLRPFGTSNFTPIP